MTYPVPPDRLGETLRHFDSATLITHELPYVKLLAVDPVMDGLELVVQEIRASTRRNISADPHVSLVWQQPTHHGWTLIVDGVGEIEDDRVRVRAESAMLHRPRAHRDGPPLPPIEGIDGAV